MKTQRRRKISTLTITEDFREYNADEIRRFLQSYKWKTCKKQKAVTRYYNVASSFDIETTSFYNQGEKQATMYIWQWGIAGLCWYGRTWDQFTELLRIISEEMKTSADGLRFVIYVHNLAYEFQFLRKWLTWENVFAIDERKVARALTVEGIEFRCSYILSGYSLAKLSEQLQKYHVKKMVGDLDYTKIRHSGTPLDDKELGYCKNDIMVVMAYIAEKIDRRESIARIPLTKTGYVRNLTRKNCYNGFKPERRQRQYNEYRELMNNLTIDADEYKELKRAFMGGFTHGSIYKSRKVYRHVGSFDFTSSYPFVMLACTFPMSKGKRVQPKSAQECEKYLSKYHCVFRLDLIGLTDKAVFEHYISASKCMVLEGATIDNGRIVSADHIALYCTELDFSIIRRMYHAEQSQITEMIVYKKGYLPKPIIETILNLYEDKTKLKNVEGMEVEYLSSKENINSVYGMTVTDIVKALQVYTGNDEWSTEQPDIDAEIEKYNKNPKRFLFYPWGVFVTAWARYNLFSGILEFGKTGDFIYSDTDSIKVLNYKNHAGYIDYYNSTVVRKLEMMCNHYNIDVERTRPRTIEGKVKQIGVWDYEGEYDSFKFLGAKRYMVYEYNAKKDAYHLNITVSGLNKKVTVPYILEKTGGDIAQAFKFFDDGMTIPPDHTGKSTHTYIDERMDGIITDYTGQTAEYHELSGIHLQAQEYKLTISREYDNLMRLLEVYEEK